MPASAPVTPAVWAKTTTISATDEAVDAEGEEPGRRALVGALGADHLEHVGLPVAHRPLGPAPEVARGAAQVLAGVAQQTGPGGVLRQDASARSAAASACSRISVSRPDSTATVTRSACWGLPLHGVDDPVAEPADLGLQRLEQLAGADELLPAGQHLAAQQGAVGGGLDDRG